MAANRIPDEIISEILSPALRVPDSTFSTLNSVAGASPFLTFSESSSAYLEVSKSWLRVGTPLLYNVVSIRSTAQAQALAATLTTNPDLGPFIRKLRVEGGYGMHMLTIIQAAPKITDIYLTLLLEKPDNASGLCQALPLLDPVRLILDGHGLFGLSTSAEELYQTLEDCVIHWGKLTRVEAQLYMARDFSEALSRMLHLDTLVVWLQSDHYSPHRFAGHVREISHNPNLKHIHLLLKLRHSFESIDSQQRLHDEFKGDPRMTALLDLPDERPSLWKRTEMDSSHGSLAYPARLAADGRQEDIIWDRVLFYALRAEIPGLPQKEDGFSRIRVHGISPSEIRFRRLYPLAVCKMFARLGLRHLYAIVVLDHDFAAHSLASQLNRRPELGLHVQGLYLDFHHIDAVFEQLVVHMPALIELQACYDHRGVTWKAFRDFAGVSGAQLQMLHGLQISDSVSTVNPNTLALFSQISNFYRDSIVKFNIAPSFAPPRTTFSTLTKLIIDKFDESFFDVLANMELPVLHTVFLESLTLCGGAAFFRMHGQKLRELKLSERQLNMRNIAIWRNCPLLTTLRIICDKKHFVQDTCLTTSETLPCLEQIFFEVLNRYDKLTTQEQIPHFNRLINALRTTKSFPALREVHHPLCKWPTTEHGKDTWSKWAEKLLTRDASVHLVGPDGVRWRPRMQVPKQPRRGRNVGLSKSK